MTAKQATEAALADLKSDDAALRQDIAVLRAQLDQSKALELLQRLATLEAEVRELKRVREETDKRHWQFVYIFAGAMASLLVTVVVQLVLAAVKT